MFSSPIFCALSEYDICFDFALESISPMSLFRRSSKKEVGHLTVFKPIIYTKLAQMLSKINSFIVNPDSFSILISILLSFEKT
jgi:hypothetical protein